MLHFVLSNCSFSSFTDNASGRLILLRLSNLVRVSARRYPKSQIRSLRQRANARLIIFWSVRSFSVMTYPCWSYANREQQQNLIWNSCELEPSQPSLDDLSSHASRPVSTPPKPPTAELWCVAHYLLILVCLSLVYKLLHWQATENCADASITALSAGKLEKWHCRRGGVTLTPWGEV